MRNGYTYVLDAERRVTSVEGKLVHNPNQVRNARAQRLAGGKDRLPTDEGGHFIGRRFNGPTDDFNHFAQNANFNRSAYAKLENEFARNLMKNKEVLVKITPLYDPKSRRPVTLLIEYTIDGMPDKKWFVNKHGGR